MEVEMWVMLPLSKGHLDCPEAGSGKTDSSLGPLLGAWACCTLVSDLVLGLRTKNSVVSHPAYSNLL